MKTESLWFRRIGRPAAWCTSVVGLAYITVTLLGFLSLESPEAPIADPHFLIMELLTLIIAPLMVVSMVAVHDYAEENDKGYAFAAIVFMALMAGITSSVHGVIMALGDRTAANPLFFSFEWPSVVYILDIIAWDWFFALSMLFAAPVFHKCSLDRTIRLLMISSGILSIAGLAGAAVGNMQIRNIGILGYAVLAPVVFGLLGVAFGKRKH